MLARRAEEAPVTAISRTFPEPRIAAAAVQDLCDAGFELDDIDIVSRAGAVCVTVRAARRFSTRTCSR